MRLSVKIIENVSGINHWNYANEATVYEGQVNEVYFQLVDLSKAIHVDGVVGEISDCPMRYMSQATTVAVSLIFPSIDDALEFESDAVQPFSDDKSIWKINIPSDKLPQSGNFQLKIVEDGIVKTFLVKSGVVAEMLNVGGC